MFVRNAWYAAAWDRDIDRGLLAVRILDEQIVLFRTASGTLGALEDACPHRKLPLSMGRIVGDLVECGYHGLTFNTDGHCVRVPCSDRIPPGARVRSYPIVERYRLLWIWMGEVQLADPAKIFHVDHWGEPGWGSNNGDALTVDANYLYVTDNLLDPSHVAWVHRESFGDASCEAVPVVISASASGITVSRWITDVDVAPFYVPYMTFAGRCDRLQHYEVRYPCHALISAVFVPHGHAGAAARQHPQAFVMDSYNFMTPIDATTTKYHWFQLRNFAPEHAGVSAAMTSAVREAFEQDRIVLGAVQRGMSGRRTPNIDIAVDSASLRFRRRLRAMADEEERRSDGGMRAAPDSSAPHGASPS